MQSHQKKELIQDIKILNERTVEQPIQLLTLILGESPNIKTLQMSIKSPEHFEKMVTFSIEDIASAPKLSLNKFNSFRNMLNGMRRYFINTYYEYRNATRHQDPTFDLRTHEPNNIAHLMMHIIPFCLHVRKVSGSNTRFLFSKIHPPFRKLLDAFDIQPIVTQKKIAGPIIKIFGSRGLAAYNILNLESYPPLSFVPEIYHDFNFLSPLSNKNKIFIARRGARSLVNHNEIENILNARGYQTVFMEDYTIEQQLGIASEAKDIVAVHGASMGMLSANQQINSLIELCPPNVYHDYFVISLSKIVKKHIQLMPCFDFRIAYNSWDKISYFKNAPFSTDKNQLALALAMID